MVKPELGTKRVCVSCGTKFYDLQRTPAVCPKCGAEQPPESPRLRRPGNVVEDRRPKKAAPEDDAAGIETDVEEDAEADDADEDAALEDDDDPIGTEIEVEPESGENDR